ncbi:MAG: TIGR04211 family SH3 domain-containing protein [Gammaproteobacteria bacterium]|nr:TIGR04211 family SH3 domain-containing protein [Gammaproteobacteria bacterium]
MKRITLLILTLLVIYPAVAEKRYISDELWINLRSGPGNDYKILKILKSGTHLQFIEEDEEAKFTKVITDKGLEGWVPTRFLQEEPISFEKLILTQRELEKTKTDFADLQRKYNETKKELAEAKRNAGSLSKDKSEQEKELEYIKKVSANAINLDKKNQELLEQSEELKIIVDTLRADNERLQNNKDLNYILVGGGLIFLGLFLGWLLPKISGRRSDNWA